MSNFATMNAIWYDDTGPACEVLRSGTLATPSPQAGEVLVRLRASGVNPSDVKARAGLRGGKSGMPYPRIVPHSDGAGVVVSSGPQASRFAPGDRVWIANGQWCRAQGTAAEFIALDETLVFPLPESVSFETGAALGIPALTACHAVCGHGPLTDKTVFISGGAGTVGALAIQVAKQAGAFVVASGRAADEARILGLGADAYVDYAHPALAGEVLRATLGRPVDHAVEVEFGNNVAALAEIMAERSTIVAYGSAKTQQPALPFYPLMFKGVRIELLVVYLLTQQERNAAAARVDALLRAGLFDVPIAAALPLAECAQAHEMVEAGRRAGAVVLSMQ
jgi:NADPH2:quinone reductase